MLFFSVQKLLFHWTQLHFTAIQICFGDYFFLLVWFLSCYVQDLCWGLSGKKKKKKLIWAILLAGATLLMLSEWRFLPSNVLFLSFCTYNLCPKGCHNDILIISWRVVTVKFNVALEPTVEKIPFYRMRAVEDLCQGLCYLNQLPFNRWG